MDDNEKAKGTSFPGNFVVVVSDEDESGLIRLVKGGRKQRV
jgi:hypothetical protein